MYNTILDISVDMSSKTPLIPRTSLSLKFKMTQEQIEEQIKNYLNFLSSEAPMICDWWLSYLHTEDDVMISANWNENTLKRISSDVNTHTLNSFN